MASDNNRSGFRGPAWIIALLAALGIGPALTSQRSQTTPAVTSSPDIHRSFAKSPASDEVPEHSAAEMLENFFDANPRQLNRDKPWSRENESAVGSDYTVDFLVASLPEPDLAALSSQFDTDLDALSKALFQQGYTLASFDLPWIREAKSDPHQFALGQTIDVTAPGADKPLWELAPPERRSEHDPGLMLFEQEGPRKLLVVFIVGESPTRGVNKIALRDALNQIVWLEGRLSAEQRAARPRLDPIETRHHKHRQQHKPPSIHSSLPLQTRLGDPYAIRIVGPSFSGSAVSVRNTVLEWCRSTPDCLARKWKVLAMSGSATSIRDDDLDPSGGPRLVKYQSMQIRDEQKELEIRKTLLPSGYGPPIVIVGEETTFGAGAAAFGPEVTYISFPLHISDLRTASSLNPPIATPLTSAVGIHNMPLRDEAGQQEEDAVPAFSNRSKVYDELVLRNLINTVRTRHARYVGIIATDVEDLIFLAQQVRANCPNVVLFTTSSDLLYAHSDFASDLEGMLVFSTFPLFQSPWDKSLQLNQFPREDAAGTYYATLEQLGIQNSPPTLWETVVGRGTLWPVSLYTPRPMIIFPIGSAGELYPSRFQSAIVLLIALCLVPCVFYFIPVGSMYGFLRESSIFRDLEDERLSRTASLIGALFITYLVGMGIYLLPGRTIFGWTTWWDLLRLSRTDSTEWSLWGLQIFALWVTLPIILLAFLFALRLALPQTFKWIKPTSFFVSGVEGRDYPVQPTTARIALLGTAVSGILVFYYLDCTFWLSPPVDSLLSFLRLANLGNRVSPLMPLIFLGIANLSLIGGDLWRLRILESCRVPTPFLNFDAAESFSGIKELEEEVLRNLECPWLNLPGTWILGLASIAAIYIFFADGRPIYPMDGFAFYLLFFVSASFIYGYFSTLMLRFVAVWRALHRLLRRLYWHPSRAAYDELRMAVWPDHSQAQWIRLLEGQPTLSALEYCLERARKIHFLLGRSSPQKALIHGRVIEAERLLALALKAHGADQRAEALRSRFEANRAAANLSSEIVRVVEPMWRLGSQEIGNEDKDILAAARLFIASRVVDFLRQIFPQLRSLALIAMTGVLAMMLAVSVYPFSNHDTMIWLTWIILLTVIAVGFTVFIQINRSRVISMLMGTSPGRFNWDSTFSFQLLIYGILPVLALLGAQFPHVFGGMLSWVTSLFSGGK